MTNKTQVKQQKKRGRTFMVTAPTNSLRRKVENMSKARRALEVLTHTERKGGSSTITVTAKGSGASGFARQLATKTGNMAASWKHIVFDMKVDESIEGEATAIVTLTPRYKVEGPKVWSK